MPILGHRTNESTTSTSQRHTLFGRSTASAPTSNRRRLFGGRKDKDRVAGGLRGALVNPNTTRGGRRHAKRELRFMGRGEETHVSFMAKVKRVLGMRSTPRRDRRSVL